MSTAKKAEKYIKRYFEKWRNIELIKPKKGETGFDFRNDKSTVFIEVKGTSKKKLSDLPFRYFTNAQYEKAEKCLRNKKRYEIHLVCGVGTPSKKDHYCIPAEVLTKRAKRETWWSLPIRKEIKKYEGGCLE